MLRRYADLLDLGGVPLWYDDQGVPRYCEFHPSKCGVYDIHIAFMTIKCQNCPRMFFVASSWSRYSGNRIHMPTRVDAGSFHWSDPPWHGGCAGETMMSSTVSVGEFWSRTTLGWERHPEYERVYPDNDDDLELV